MLEFIGQISLVKSFKLWSTKSRQTHERFANLNCRLET
jgi:hypothetical protein